MSALVHWAVVIFLVAGPILVAAFSPLLRSREAVYIVGGLAGVVALTLLLIQPLLAIGFLKNISPMRHRLWHLWTGVWLIITVFVHIIALYLTSPDDVMDALLLQSATPFSVYGVIGLVGLVTIAVLVVCRKQMNVPSKWWRAMHAMVGVSVVIASVVHALWIQGTMGAVSKWVLCGTILIVTTFSVGKLEVVQGLLKKHYH